MNNKQYLIISTTITLFLVRFWETVMFLFFEKSFLWQSIKNDNFDHYQLGLLLLIVCRLFWKKLNGKLKMIIFGIGVGLTIDDVYQILSILFGLPYTFNSFPEWASALGFYLAFLLFLTMKNQSTISQFNTWAPSYDSGVSHYFFDSCNHEVIKILKLRTNTKLLDVGCGTGNLLLEFNKNSKDSVLYGVDLSPKMIQIAKSKLGNLKNISFQIGSGDKLLFESNFFDYVICSHSLHHHPNSEKSLSEMTRVLKPEGILIVIDGFTNGLLRKINFFITQIVQNEGFVQRYKKQEMFSFFKKLKYQNIIQKEILYFNLLTKGVKAL